jgi:gentisate 1,2-dioxygenase
MAQAAHSDIRPSATPEESARIFAPAAGTFSRGLPPVPPKVFLEERALALDPHAPTGLIVMDISDVLGTPYPATTPMMLARYAVVRSGERLSCRLIASGEICYVISGSGRSRKDDDLIEWQAGDAFVLPGGGGETIHEADQHAILYIVTNEPELAYGGLDAPSRERGKVVPARYTGQAIRDELSGVQRGSQTQVAAEYVNLTNARMYEMRTMLPTIVAGVNTLEPGTDQRPHKHSATALTLAIESEGMHSMVDGVRYDWAPWAVILTPPTAVHSHHNRGSKMMFSFVTQDSGIFHYTRTSGFQFAE